jgi:prepilin-type N-terminal cleavage/methylation domain-containing protein
MIPPMSVSKSRFKPAFTLIELLVVILIISVLMGLLIPAVNSARQSARSTQSKNNLKQIGLALNVFQASKGYFPPSAEFPSQKMSGDDANPWSVQTLLLPYLEQSGVHADLDYTQDYKSAQTTVITTADGVVTKLAATRIPTYISPAEPRDEPHLASDGTPNNYPINYAMNLGTWLVFDPVTREGGNGAGYPGSRLRDTAFTDGLSNTLAFAEVKAWQHYAGDTGKTNADLASALPNAVFDPTVTKLSMVAALGSLISGSTVKPNGGHSEWIEGRAHHCGFTTVFGPNQKVMLADSGSSPSLNAAGTGDMDMDWTNWKEGKGMFASTAGTTPTYAAITARGYFDGIVNVSMMDGSVRSIDDRISLGVWRAISTRNGNEKLPNSFNQN